MPSTRKYSSTRNRKRAKAKARKKAARAKAKREEEEKERGEDDRLESDAKPKSINERWNEFVRGKAKAKRDEREGSQRNEEEVDADPMKERDTVTDRRERHDLLKQEEEVDNSKREISTQVSQAADASQQRPNDGVGAPTIIIGSSKLVIDQNGCKHGCANPVQGYCIRSTLFEFYEYVLEAAVKGEEIDEFIYFTAGEAMESSIQDIVTQLESAISYSIWEGTELILNGNHNRAHRHVTHITYFEHALKTLLLTKPGIPQRSGFIKSGIVDDHTLVSFFRKRIPCTCLDEKYEVVKSITKMNVCENPSCNRLDRRAARSKMFYCAQCKQANYCSRECQKSDWKRHKDWCNYI